MRLKDKVAVVTGAGAGIGRAIALGLAREGAAVACADVNGEGADATARQVEAGGGRAFGTTTDIREVASLEALLRETVARFGRVHVLCANAGGSAAVKPFLELTPEDWKRDTALNFDGAFYSGLVFAKHLATNGGGSIVFTSSQLSEVTRPNHVAYAAAKSGVRMLVKGMAVDLAPHNIRVNAIAPGPTLSERILKRHTEESLAQEVKLVPIGRLGQPEDLAGAAIFLASEESAWVTGTTIFVDGGYTVV